MATESTEIPKTRLAASSGQARGCADRKIKSVAYIMTWFPKLSETFVLREMLEMESLGYQVEVFPLRQGDTQTSHKQAAEFVRRAHFTNFLSWEILWANLLAMTGTPLLYFGTLWTLLRANFGSSRYFLGAVIYFPKAVFMARKLKRMKIDHVHAHFASHPAAVAFVINRFSQIPYSFTAHGSDLHRDQHMLSEKLENASCVITISKYNRDLILRVCGKKHSKKVVVVHCGINTQQFKPDLDSAPIENKHSLNLICIGTLHEVKGQAVLIEACQILKSRNVAFHCTFVGGGPDSQKLGQMVASQNLLDDVTFAGPCVESDVKKLLRRSDVLVCPSVPTSDGRREGIPVVLMEGMAMGLPCVASDISGIPEIVMTNENGFLTPPGDAAKIADAIEALANDKSLRLRLSAKAIETTRTKFDLQKNVETLANVFEINHQFQEAHNE